MRWAVILAGGSGTRFWPLSTATAPKQILPLLPGGSTAAAAVRRLAGLVPRERVLVVTNPTLAGPLAAALDLKPANMLVEPAPKSTGPALVWATHEIRRRDPAATILSLHSDWDVPDEEGFRRAADRALTLALDQPLLVTVGVVPARPETGYGYLKAGTPIDDGFRVTAFHEKPTAQTAERLIAEGGLWNSGLFAWRAEVLLSEVALVCPELAVGRPYLDRLDVAGFFDAVKEISIDVGVLERSGAVAVVRGDFAWDDVGTWDALGRVRAVDVDGNMLEGSVVAIDSERVIGWSEGTPIVAAWVKDLVIVEANGRILVMDRRRAGDMKILLERLPPAIRDLP